MDCEFLASRDPAYWVITGLSTRTKLNPVPQIHIHADSQKVTLFASGVFAHVVSSDEVTLHWGESYIQHEWCFYMNRHRHTGKSPCEDGGRG